MVFRWKMIFGYKMHLFPHNKERSKSISEFEKLPFFLISNCIATLVSPFRMHSKESHSNGIALHWKPMLIKNQFDFQMHAQFKRQLSWIFDGSKFSVFIFTCCEFYLYAHFDAKISKNALHVCWKLYVSSDEQKKNI